LQELSLRDNLLDNKAPEASGILAKGGGTAAEREPYRSPQGRDINGAFTGKAV
jgi:hypothetical protein